ncbi:DNA repair protein RAD51 homolog 4-like [Amphiura filiformis]|uniref:DNA repair protein RAD51 homolog 4-like n=1 Tax=Amphiura filiformis TaxID=82378 RepID=UPI003B20CEB6
MTLLRVGLCPALSTDVLESLNKASIKTVLDFVCSDLEKLSQVCSVSYKVLVSIRRLLLAQYSSYPVNGTDLYNDVMSVVAILPTGCSSLDELLDGGLYTSEVLEIAGGSGVGKTQLCTSIAASIAVSSEQNVNVLYIDTSGGFSCQRLQDMMVARNIPEKAMIAAFQRIQCTKVFDLFEVIQLLENTKHSIDSGSDTFYSALKVVVLDSVTAIVAPVIGGQQTEGHAMMMHLGRALKGLAAEYSIAVLLTNNLVQGSGGEKKPALGRTWLHVPHTRILVSCNKGDGDPSLVVATEQRHVKLIKSSRQPLNIVRMFKIGDQGAYS